MATVAELQRLINISLDGFKARATNADEIASKIAAIDPSSSTAQSDLDALMAERTAYKAANDAASQAASDAAIAYAKTFGFFDDKALAQQLIDQFASDIKSSSGAASERLAAALKSMQDQIAAAEKPKEDDTPPADTEPVPSAAENTPSPNTLTGTADGDSSYDKAELAKLQRQQTTAQANISAANAGTTTAGQAGVSAAQIARAKGPGRRTDNPLSKFSSSTYQLSLYMITPDAYRAFIESGRRNINALAPNSPGSGGNGAFLVAQSGGINTNSNARAKGFELDYYIDDLKITSLITAGHTRGFANLTDVSFTVTEPYGFSFLNNLKLGLSEISQSTRSSEYAGKNPTRQFFILGIRFQGYDKNGTQLTGNGTFSHDTFNDPTSSANGIFERFYEILIHDIKFKLGNSVTTYSVTAKTIGPEVAMTTKRGLIKSGAKVVANNVMEALTGSGNGAMGLLTKLNLDQQAMYDDKKITIKNNYDVEFIGDSDAIKNATIVTKADLDKTKTPLNQQIKNKREVNPAFTVTSPPDLTKKVIQFAQNEPILQAINQIIAQSSYLQDALIAVQQSELETDPSQGNTGYVKTDSNRKIKWYNICARVKVLGFDTKTNDYAYDITYIIQPYETPVIISSYANATTKYYGPHKRYDYWYTGKNSEIISYEQVLNNNYATTVIASPSKQADSGGDAGVPAIPNMFTGLSQDGRQLGGMEAENNYMVSLTDPANWAKAHVTILGDPDYLMQDTSGGIDAVYDQFYGPDRFTINPNGGQVFVEIDFKEAIDYKNSVGLMQINEALTFWAYPKDIQKQIQGVSYQLTKCVSMFRQGKFTQDLELKINTFSSGDLDSSGSTPDQARPATISAADAAAKRDAFGATDPRRIDLPNQTVNTLARAGVKADVSAGDLRTGATRSVPTLAGFTADDDGSTPGKSWSQPPAELNPRITPPYNNLR